MKLGFLRRNDNPLRITHNRHDRASVVDELAVILRVLPVDDLAVLVARDHDKLLRLLLCVGLQVGLLDVNAERGCGCDLRNGQLFSKVDPGLCVDGGLVEHVALRVVCEDIDDVRSHENERGGGIELPTRSTRLLARVLEVLFRELPFILHHFELEIRAGSLL